MRGRTAGSPSTAARRTRNPAGPAKHYNYFRDYDPTVGRYLESDPIGLRGGLSTYAYALGTPVAYVDADGRKVVFLGSGSNVQALKDAYSVVRNTPRGKTLCEALEKSPLTYGITGDAPFTAKYDPRTRTIRVDPSFHPAVQTTAGPQASPTEVILGHELGHAATGTKDEGPGDLDNVNQNENPIRKALGYPLRTKY